MSAEHWIEIVAFVLVVVPVWACIAWGVITGESTPLPMSRRMSHEERMQHWSTGCE